MKSILLCALAGLIATSAMGAEQWDVFETSFTATRKYDNPFLEVQVDVVFCRGDQQWLVPAFWAGGDKWTVRFAPPVQGEYTFQVKCSDPANLMVNGAAQTLHVTAYTGDNLLLKHGFLRVAGDKRHFEHADGTPFLWLGDTWWKGLCKRMTWEGFQELTADRKPKGFNAVQIVCGPYPDENMMETRWENEGGKPYETKDFSVVNPRYFDFADRRIKHLVDAEMVPVIGGGWGRPQGGGKSTLAQVGLDGFKRHWRNLIARYGAYPIVWIVGGEAKDAYGPWSELARYLKATDPYDHPLTYHAPEHPRQAIKDNAMFDFDMVGIGHEGYQTAAKSLELMKSCLSQAPAKPVLCGEACYEGHMQTNFQDLQRHLFWSFMLSGAAGHTYGAAGIWQASVAGDPGIDPVYDWTTWKEGMNYPGSTQLGIGKKLLEQYPWSRFEVHPEWAEKDCFAAGIPREGQVHLPAEAGHLQLEWNDRQRTRAQCALLGVLFRSGHRETLRSRCRQCSLGRIQITTAALASGLGAGPRKQRTKVNRSFDDSTAERPNSKFPLSASEAEQGFAWVVKENMRADTGRTRVPHCLPK